jgi:hypothetical protein
MYEPAKDIYSITIRFTGVAYDSCLTIPTETTLQNGKTRTEYGLNVGIDENTANMIAQEYEKAQIKKWEYVDDGIILPTYEGKEIGIPEPYAVTLGTIYKPSNRKEIPDGTPVDIIANIRTHQGEKRHGVLINLVKVRESQADKRRFFRKKNTPQTITPIDMTQGATLQDIAN